MSGMKIAITGAGTIAIQFGLAIAGWSSFFAHSAFRALAGVTAVLVVLTAFSGGGGLSTGQAEDRSNRWVLGAFGVIGLSVFFFSSYTDRIRFWTFDGDTVRWLGVVVCFFGGLLRLIPVYVLGNRFSGLVAIQPEHKLATKGIFGTIRNPLSGAAHQFAGMGVGVFRSGVGVLLVASMLVPLIARMQAEERLLRKHFGSEYDAYCARTWRLGPGIY